LPWTIDSQSEVEVAYTIVQEYWGQGLATEAAQAILEYGFGKLNLAQLICLIDPDSIASQRVAGKIGMTLEKKGHDEMGDFLIFAISKTR
jgi:[ribosomal protein S5]-alanine N-acetyltransferase